MYWFQKRISARRNKFIQEQNSQEIAESTTMVHQLANAPQRAVQPFNIHLEEPLQKKAGLLIEDCQYDTQPEATAPPRKGGCMKKIAWLFKRNRVYPQNTNQEEPAHGKAGPSTEDCQYDTQPGATAAPKKGGCMKKIARLFDRNRGHRVNIKQDEPAKKTAVGWGFRATVRKICPCYQLQSREDDTIGK